MKNTWRFLWTGSFLILTALQASGCFYGTFQTAEPLGKGNSELTVYTFAPSYTSQKERKKADEDNYAAPGAFGLVYQVGVTENADAGLQFLPYALGINGKISLGRELFGARLATFASLNYLLGRAQIAPKISVIGGRDFGGVSLYTGGELFRGPDWEEQLRADKKNSISDIPDLRDGTATALFFGARISTGNAGLENRWIPQAFYFELSVPLDVRYRTVLFGIGMSGMSGKGFEF
jgi:hypothetical protein